MAESGKQHSGGNPQPPPSEQPASIELIRSEDILKGAREIHIQHADEVYRLRMTRKGKLILYK